MVKIYKQPFAHGGDTIAIPDASQPDGKMSSADGWTPDYQLKKTEPNYKPVGRQELNGVFKEVTEALGQVQVQGSATWSADGAPYPVNAQVYHSGKQWLALRANSVAPVDGADWSAIGTAATANLTTSNLDGTVGRVLKVGDGGWMGQGEVRSEPYGYPTSIADDTNQTKVIASGAVDNGVAVYSAGIHFSAVNVWGRLRVDYTPSAWIQGGLSDTGQGWTSRVVLSANILQTTGSSTEFPMSQAAVTDAINDSAIGIGQTWQDVTASRSAGTTYTNTTGRPIQVAVGFIFTSTTARSYHISIDGLTIPINTAGPTDVVIPNGSTYSAVISGTASIAAWWELR